MLHLMPVLIDIMQITSHFNLPCYRPQIVSGVTLLLFLRLYLTWHAGINPKQYLHHIFKALMWEVKGIIVSKPHPQPFCHDAVITSQRVLLMLFTNHYCLCFFSYEEHLNRGLTQVLTVWVSGSAPLFVAASFFTKRPS